MSSKGLRAFNIEGFGGLQLAADPDEVGSGGAIDMRNVDLDHRGRIRQRDGMTAFGATTGVFSRLWSSTIGGTLDRVLAVDTGAVRAFDGTGGLLSSQAGASFGANAVARVGTPSATSIYVVNAVGGAWKLNGTTWSTASLNGAAFLAVQSTDNRLVAASSAANPYRVWFSDPGAPETFGTNNYVDLAPGDGDPPTAMVAWRDYVFVFKSNKFMVFYGNSPDAQGNPVFNYRTVDTGAGSIGGGVVALADGVYFLAKDGLYRTSGGPAVKVSAAIEPWFRGEALLYFTGDTFSSRLDLALGSAGSRVFISYRKVQTDSEVLPAMATLVYDAALDAWLYWDIDAAHVVEGSVASPATAGVVTSKLPYPMPLVAIARFSTTLQKMVPGVTLDLGASFAGASWYRSGFFDLGEPGMEKTVRQTELVGQGTVNLTWYRDMAVAGLSHGTQDNVVLGASTSRGLHRNAMFGEQLGFQLLGVSDGWLVDRLTPMVRESRPAGTFS